MVFQVNLLIYMYMILCICLLLYNIVYLGRERFSNKQNLVKIQEYKESINGFLEREKIEKLSEKEEKFWFRKLMRCSQLILFEEAAEELRAEGKRGKIEEWVWENKDLFYKLGTFYMKKRGMEKALFAYIVEQYHLCGPGERDPFALQMEWLARDHSIYCRENALYALCAGGQAVHIVKAYHILTRMRIEHSSKMVTDGLMGFQGDRKLLAEELWENWGHFSPYYQICFVNFMRMVSGEFSERLLKILKDGDNDRELHFAAIRYLRRYHFAEAEEVLCKFVENWDESDWEYAALSALSLETYPGKRSIEALKRGCASRNWYVRYNSAQSLASMIKPEEKRKIIQSERDLYAKEMLEYKLQGKEDDTDDGCD